MKSIKESHFDKLKMDKDDINDIFQRCALLRHKFLDVFAANNFPQKLKPISFLIVNAATAESFGTHWLVLCQKTEGYQLFFADPPGQSISSYKEVYQRKISLEENAKIYHLLKDQPIQSKNSKFCGFFCVYIAHYILNAQKIVKLSDAQLIRFAFHMMY